MQWHFTSSAEGKTITIVSVWYCSVWLYGWYWFNRLASISNM